MELFDKIQECVQYIQSKTKVNPKIGIILGSGLSNLTKEINIIDTIPYNDLPHFAQSTVKGHGGSLVFGTLEGKEVVCMSGRFHYYEGHSIEAVTFPVRVMKYLGVTHLLVSNASGGMKAGMEVGDLMIITDHINLQPEHPLRGKNDERLGPRFPGMLDTYDKEMIATGLQIAKSINARCHTGVYVGVQGPTFETPSEYQYFARIGGDAVGMSTVPEVIVARHGGMKVFAISVVSDIGYPFDAMDEKISHDIVLAKASAAEPVMTAIIKGLIHTHNF
ncbi:MAG: purine-nucleoside phosphorylase [Bacteroidota bacterium]